MTVCMSGNYSYRSLGLRGEYVTKSAICRILYYYTSNSLRGHNWILRRGYRDLISPSLCMKPCMYMYVHTAHMSRPTDS